MRYVIVYFFFFFSYDADTVTYTTVTDCQRMLPHAICRHYAIRCAVDYASYRCRAVATLALDTHCRCRH